MRIVILFFMLCFNSFHLSANQIPEVPLESYGNLANKSKLVLSPSANRIAFRDKTTESDYLVVYDLVKNEMISRVDISMTKILRMHFITENRLIVITLNHKDWYFNYEDVLYNKSLIFNIETNQFTPYETPGRVGILGFSADKKSAFMHNRDLYKVDLENGRKPKLIMRGTSDTIDYFLGIDGKILARERYNQTLNSHRIDSYLDGNWVEVFRVITPTVTKFFSGLTPDRKHLVMIDKDKNLGRQAYFTLSLIDGTISEPIFSHKDKDVENVILDVDRIVHGVRYSGFIPSYEFFNKKLNARMRGLQKAMPDSHFTLYDYTKDWHQMAFYIDGPQSSGELILYNNGQLNLLAEVRPDIPPRAVHPVSSYNFEARDGLIIPSLLTLPRSLEPKNLPAILLPHGGPESYDTMHFNWLTQYFASQGYVVIQPQFRGSEGFGDEHLLAGHGEWGRKMQDDLTDAVLDMIDKGVVDKSRVCIVGMSYGGYAAFAGATFTPDIYKCSVAVNGVSDVDLWHERVRSSKRNSSIVTYWRELLAKGDIKEEHLEQISPINFVKNIKAPMLIIYSELDWVVPKEQSENMIDEMEDEEKEFTSIELIKGTHSLSDSKNRMQALKAIDKFLKKNL